MTAMIFVSRAASLSAFATATMSPSPTNAIAVGPSSNSTRLGTPASSAARFASVFFTTENFAPCFKSSVRTPFSCVTSSPR